MIIQILGAFATIYFFSIMLESPKKYLVWAGIVGAIGWGSYLFFDEIMDLGPVMSSFLSVIIIAAVSHISARVYKAPVTLFLIAGILPTVPGAGMYRIVNSLTTHSFTMAVQYFVETLEIAGAISLAIVIVDSVFKTIDKHEWLKSKE